MVMASLLIKNVPDILHRKLKERAASRHRSMNGEVIAILEAVLEAETVSELPDPVPLRGDITEAVLREMREEGRE